ncbi:MAG: YfcC family protein, partial [Firmicutes bacterium]|nr:YfcC family protein [Bacillota bacterium]
MGNNQKKGFTMPHNYVIIFCIILLAVLLTYVVPAGSYDRTQNAAGRTVVVDGSFHYIDQTPVGPFQIFECMAQGFNEVSDIIFFIIFAYAWVNLIIQNGTFNAMMGAILRRFGTRIKLLIPVLMMVFGILGSTMGMSEETYGLLPVFVGVAIALGYDALVGGAMVYIGVATGFASATLNPFTIGVAMSISEVPYPYGLGLRIIILCVFEAAAIWYVMRYVNKLEKDPRNSLLYGMDLNLGSGATKEDLLSAQIETKHILTGISFLVTVFFIVFGVIKWGWYINELSALFIVSMLVVGIISRMTPNDIAKSFVNAARDMVFGALVVGLARGIVVVLSNGNVIDTIIYGLSNSVVAFSNALGAFGHYATAIGMLVVQNIINCFIGSGSGQASAVMPIMAPLSDMLG